MFEVRQKDAIDAPSSLERFVLRMVRGSLRMSSPAQDGFAIDNKGGVAVTQRGFRNEGIAVAPVVSVSSEQAHALALALNYQAVAVVFDLMQPVRAGRNLGSRDAGLER